MGYATFNDLPTEVVKRIVETVDDMRLCETLDGDTRFDPTELSLFQLARVNRLCRDLVLDVLFPRGSLIIFKLDKYHGVKGHLWRNIVYRACYARIKQDIIQRAQIVFKQPKGSKHTNYVIMRTNHSTQGEKVEALKFLECWILSMEDGNIVTDSARILRYGILQAWQAKKTRKLAEGGCVNGWNIEHFSDYLLMILYLWRLYPSTVDWAKSSRRSFHPNPKPPKRNDARELHVSFLSPASANRYKPLQRSPLGQDEGFLHCDNQSPTIPAPA